MWCLIAINNNQYLHLILSRRHKTLNSYKNVFLVIAMLEQPSTMRTNIGLLITYTRHQHPNNLN